MQNLMGSLTFRITGLVGFVHRQPLYEIENTPFRKLDLFPSSDEGEENTYSVGSFTKS
jgi:hypothetical protein